MAPLPSKISCGSNGFSCHGQNEAVKDLSVFASKSKLNEVVSALTFTPGAAVAIVINDISLFIVIVIIYPGRRNRRWRSVDDANKADEGGKRERPYS